ncbi:hypothetical protein I4U23_022984 [Adineta vaga]|nr:hypothetical protein I4U23_022984 [Adineta vaga]
MSEVNSNLLSKPEKRSKRDNIDDDQCNKHSSDDSETQRTSLSSNINDSLIVFTGSLRDACVKAFEPSAISDRRPVLIYIYRNKDTFREKMCEKSLYSQTIMAYLNSNYVVWSCDIASESDRFTLSEMWKEMFCNEFYDDFSDEKYPLLIGVMRLFERNANEIVTSEYQFQKLVQDNTLLRTQMTVNDENLLTELTVFKENCYENEKNPIFSFVEKTHLTWEIILEIAKYLSLNDAINTFSIDILSLLDHSQAKFHLSDPSGLFIKKILPKIDNEKIVSLQFRTKFFRTNVLQFLYPSKKLTSITFHDLHDMYLNEYDLRYYRNWTRLCLYYDREINYKILEKILYEFQYQLKQFEIHCPGLYVCYGNYDTPKDLEKKMVMVEYFLLDISLQSARPMYGFNESHQRQYFMVEMKLMKTMPNIRYLHLIIQNDDVERVCYFTVWQLIALTFPKLTKIRIDVRGSSSENKESLIKQALKLQTDIGARRKSFKFHIRSL